jgi:hypothetical protein
MVSCIYYYCFNILDHKPLFTTFLLLDLVASPAHKLLHGTRLRSLTLLHHNSLPLMGFLYSFVLPTVFQSPSYASEPLEQVYVSYAGCLIYESGCSRWMEIGT